MTYTESLEKEIKAKINEIGFIELKEDVKIKDNIYLKKGIDYPLKFSYIKSGLKDDTISKGIDLDKLIDSMLFLLGIDSPNLDKKIYEKLVKEILIKPADYIIEKTNQYFNEDYLDAIIYCRAYRKIFNEDIRIKFIELQGIEYYIKSREKNFSHVEMDKINAEITNNYLDLIQENKEFALPYLSLAYIYEKRSHYIKAKLYLGKYINLSKDQASVQEAREELIKIEDYVAVETAQTYLAYGENYKALDALNKVSMDYEDEYLLYLLKGQVQYNLGKFKEAIKDLEKSCKKEITENNATLLAMSYTQNGQISPAKKVLEEAIRKINDSNILYYDLGIINLKQNNLNKALDNFKNAYKLKADNELLKIIEKLEKNLDNK